MFRRKINGEEKKKEEKKIAWLKKRRERMKF